MQTPGQAVQERCGVHALSAAAHRNRRPAILLACSNRGQKRRRRLLIHCSLYQNGEHYRHTPGGRT
ncbi:hypothetical protein BS78_05G023300 [Paspalum vaginatum]|nr:hypothetical protein BS78_05G023300 [Paspalum vaginatum]